MLRQKNGYRQTYIAGTSYSDIVAVIDSDGSCDGNINEKVCNLKAQSFRKSLEVLNGWSKILCFNEIISSLFMTS